jgi:hypothetical protein
MNRWNKQEDPALTAPALAREPRPVTPIALGKAQGIGSASRGECVSTLND